MYTLLILLQAAPQQNPLLMPLLLGAMVLVFYFFMIRPQAKKAKQTKQFHDNLQKGDKVVTIAGIHGTINRINDDGTIMVETSPGSYMKMEKTSVHIDWTQNINKPVADKK